MHQHTATYIVADAYALLQLDRMPRNAMVSAEVATTCLALAAWDFDAVLLEQPRLTLAILRGLAARLRQVSDSARH